MAQGEVLYYSEKIGYCFIRPNDGGEGIFIPRTAIARTNESEPLEPGDRVTYGTAPDDRKARKPEIPPSVS